MDSRATLSNLELTPPAQQDMLRTTSARHMGYLPLLPELARLVKTISVNTSPVT